MVKYKFNVTQKFKSHLEIWKSQHNQKVLNKIDILTANILVSPFKGIGKPEPLKHTKGVWSRRITKEHRLTYVVNEDVIHLLTCKEHYK